MKKFLTTVLIMGMLIAIQNTCDARLPFFTPKKAPEVSQPIDIDKTESHTTVSPAAPVEDKKTQDVKQPSPQLDEGQPCDIKKPCNYDKKSYACPVNPNKVVCNCGKKPCECGKAPCEMKKPPCHCGKTPCECGKAPCGVAKCPCKANEFIKNYFCEVDKMLCLNEEQKAEAAKIRECGSKKMRPLIEQYRTKKREIHKLECKCAGMEKAEKDKQIRALKKEKRAIKREMISLRKQTEKEFKAMLTKEQKATYRKIQREKRKVMREMKKASCK